MAKIFECDWTIWVAKNGKRWFIFNLFHISNKYEAKMHEISFQKHFVFYIYYEKTCSTFYFQNDTMIYYDFQYSFPSSWIKKHRCFRLWMIVLIFNKNWIESDSLWKKKTKSQMKMLKMRTRANEFRSPKAIKKRRKILYECTSLMSSHW